MKKKLTTLGIVILVVISSSAIVVAEEPDSGDIDSEVTISSIPSTVEAGDEFETEVSFNIYSPGCYDYQISVYETDYGLIFNDRTKVGEKTIFLRADEFNNILTEKVETTIDEEARDNDGTGELQAEITDDCNQQFDIESDTFTTEVIDSNSPPNPDFTTDPSRPKNPGETILFDPNPSTDPDGDDALMTYKWDWDNDGNYEETTTTVTSHTFNSEVDQVVTMKAIDDLGGENTITKTIDMNNQPTADFSLPLSSPQAPADGTGVEVDFFGFYSDDVEDSANELTYEWEMENRGDEGISHRTVASVENPTKRLYPGTYDITLTVIDQDGGTDTVTKTLTIERESQPPTADAGLDRTTSVGDSVTFDGSDSTDNVQVDTYEWDIDGDGFYEKDGQSISHTFQNVGSKTVTLRVSDPAGNTDTDTVSVTVEDRSGPTADAGSDKTIIVGSSVTLDGSGSSDDVGITTYEWDFDGDGNYEESRASPTISHTFPSVGTEDVTLRVRDRAGNTDTDTVSVTVEDGTSPTADAGSDKTTAVGSSVTLDGSGSSDNIGIATYEWDFDGDGNYEESSESPSISHTFQSVGPQDVTLRVTDNAGNTDTDTVSVTVEDRSGPTADAGSDRTTAVGSSVTLDGSGSSDNVGITTYEWDLDDDGDYEESSESPSISYPFQSTGTKEVTLRVTDDAGNTDTDTVSVTVEDQSSPTADAGSDKTTTPESSVTLDGSGSSDNVGITTYEWDLDDDGDYEESSESPSVTHTFQSTGSTTVTLRVSDAAGNTDTDTIEVTVESQSSIEEAIDSNNNNQIDSREILQAIQYWRTNEVVPGTDGETISSIDILELIRLWRTTSGINAG